MAKKKQQDDELNNDLAPMEERTTPLERPKAVHPSHLKPMEEVKPSEIKRPKLAHPSHAKPME